VFEAIACHNAFPALHFSADAFAHLVVEALRRGTPLAQLHGLAERTTAGMITLVEEFAAERRAAGRPVPDDATRLLGTA
jgi:hypothetical protein